MKKLVVIAIQSVLCIGSLFAQSQQQLNSVLLDTVYFSSNWDKNSFPKVASYYRVVEKGDTYSIKKYKDYYITGQIQGEGSVISIGNNDSLSVFEGDQVTYFRNGRIESFRSFKNGKLDGDCYLYDENGLVKWKRGMKDGKADGLFTQFQSDGSYVQIDYKNGEYASPFYYYCDRMGRVSKLSVYDNSLYFTQLYRDSRKVYYRDGITWQYYENEGMTIAMTVSSVREYGRFYKVDVVLTNNTVAPILFNATDLTGKLYDSYEEAYTLKTWTVEEYMKRVNNRQAWAAVAVGLAEGMASAGAGYSTSNSYSTTYYNGNHYGSNYSGIANTYTTTTTYDAAAAYQARVLSNQRIDEFNRAQRYEYQEKNAGYIKLNTIYPGERVSGFVMLERKKGASLVVIINVAGIPYYFDWNVSQ